MLWHILILLNKEDNITSDWEIITNMSEFSKILDPGSIVSAQLTRDAPNIFLEVDWNLYWEVAWNKLETSEISMKNLKKIPKVYTHTHTHIYHAYK